LDHFRVSTADVPEREQFSFWRDAFGEGVLGNSGEPLTATDRGFRAEAEARIAPSLVHVRYSGENYAVSRGSREIGRRPWHSVVIYHEQGPGASHQHSGREFVTNTGDFFVADSDQPSFATQAHYDYRHDIWLLPRSLFTPHLPASRGPLSVSLPGGAGLAGVLAAYLGSLGREMGGLAPPELDAVVDNLARLVAVMCGAAQGEHRSALQAALAERVRAHIARHLADPDLAPANAAAALGVSERKLHRRE
jgi:hypothetical protein